ncbi:hypothetical protein FSB78_00145 [Sphingomonas ginsenosidivorax]|uniref:Circumsporozoite protein n=1 Tax=Sphingomonas ginsenosidivorax TaxID=862135 RepID=A0A5C6U8X0_9SPHN|nr:hypothetical protein [Sphingomonas ginsenosidivorax]TXC69553.1 hypothetical protein FSB78_00145 [Sphingomonas ginsenosidivorax]
MKKIALVPMMAVLALGVAACSKTADTSNTTTESNTIVEESDANLSVTDGLDATNTTGLINSEDPNASGNAL